MKLYLDKYLDKSTTDNVKGVFIIMVFISHIIPYLDKCGANLDGNLINIPVSIVTFLGQLIVVMFLFYSGYGVMYSILSKGRKYIAGMPKNRILTTQLNFIVAVLVFLLVQLVFLSKTFEPTRLGLSLLGWESIGNSNWYIFDIVLCYLVTYFIFRHLSVPVLGQSSNCDGNGGIYTSNVRRLFWLCFLVIAFFTIILSVFKEGWWYNTVLAYPFGMFWRIYQVKIERILSRYFKYLLFGLISAFVAYQFFPYKPYPDLLHNFRGIIFASIVLLITMLYPIQNSLLGFLGRNLFPLYIYQRIPMLLLSEFDNGTWAAQWPAVYVMLSLFLTLLLVLLYRYIEVKPAHFSRFKLA